MWDKSHKIRRQLSYLLAVWEYRWEFIFMCNIWNIYVIALQCTSFYIPFVYIQSVLILVSFMLWIHDHLFNESSNDFQLRRLKTGLGDIPPPKSSESTSDSKNFLAKFSSSSESFHQKWRQIFRQIILNNRTDHRANV